jgi:uncharacterized protein (DUF4415 family)
MNKRPDPQLIDKENPEWTEDDFKRAHPLTGLPSSLRGKLKRRGPQKAPRKVPVSIRLSPDVVDHFRATGAGWQKRMDEALKDWIDEHQKAA